MVCYIKLQIIYRRICWEEASYKILVHLEHLQSALRRHRKFTLALFAGLMVAFISFSLNSACMLVVPYSNMVSKSRYLFLKPLAVIVRFRSNRSGMSYRFSNAIT